MVSKQKCQRQHFKTRAIQRFGLQITSRLRDQIISDIQNNKAKFLGRQSNRITIWHVEVEAKSMKVVYDKYRKELVTALIMDEDE